MFDIHHNQTDLPQNSLVQIKIHPNFRVKMDPVYKWPYPIIRKHQKDAYVLRDTTGEILAQSHNITHLKPVIVDHVLDLEITQEVENIIAHTLDQDTNKNAYQVKWKALDGSYHQWVSAKEYLEALSQKKNLK